MPPPPMPYQIRAQAEQIVRAGPSHPIMMHMIRYNLGFAHMDIGEQIRAVGTVLVRTSLFLFGFGLTSSLT